MFLETTDGISMLGYAGLGATSLGTEPSDWMSAVLRGQSFPLEQSLGLLADAMKRQFPRHLHKIPKNNVATHEILIPSFVDNDVRLYTIGLALAPDRKSYHFGYTRHLFNNLHSNTKRTPRFGLAGSGGVFLSKNREWIRDLLHLVNACDKLRISPNAVADHLSTLNYYVHSVIGDKSVGPSCIIAWRFNREGVHKGGGGHQAYIGTARDNAPLILPIIGNGMDIKAIIGALMPMVADLQKATQTGEAPKELDKDEINARLAQLHNDPDENLR
jgi:hypothetical protein